MALSETLTLLLLSFAVTGYLYYGIVHVPEDMDGRDDVMWMYGKRKLTQTLVSKELGYRLVECRKVYTFTVKPSRYD